MLTKSFLWTLPLRMLSLPTVKRGWSPGKDLSLCYRCYSLCDWAANDQFRDYGVHGVRSSENDAALWQVDEKPLGAYLHVRTTWQISLECGCHGQQLGQEG